MADEKQLARLRENVAAWNEWREENLGVRPDLSAADLSGADLREANLRGADLCGADLSGADLSGADLSGTDLSGTDLCRATICDTNFHNAIISYQNKKIKVQFVEIT